MEFSSSTPSYPRIISQCVVVLVKRRLLSLCGHDPAAVHLNPVVSMECGGSTSRSLHSVYPAKTLYAARELFLVVDSTIVGRAGQLDRISEHVREGRRATASGEKENGADASPLAIKHVFSSQLHLIPLNNT